MSVARSYAHCLTTQHTGKGRATTQTADLQSFNHKKEKFSPSEVKGHLKSSSHNKHVAKVVNSVHKVKNLA